MSPAPAPDTDNEERRAAAARAEVWSILTRSQRVDEWPEDERRLHRRGDWRSFSDRNAAVLSLRVDKIMAAALPVSPVQPGAPDELRQRIEALCDAEEDRDRRLHLTRAPSIPVADLRAALSARPGEARDEEGR